MCKNKMKDPSFYIKKYEVLNVKIREEFQDNEQKMVERVCGVSNLSDQL